MALYFRDTDPYHGHAQIAELEIVYDEHGKFFHASHAGKILKDFDSEECFGIVPMSIRADSSFKVFHSYFNFKALASNCVRNWRNRRSLFKISVAQFAQNMNIGQTASIVLRRAVVNIKLVHLAIPELTVV